MNKKSLLIIIVLLIANLSVGIFWYISKESVSQNSSGTDDLIFAVEADPHMDEQSSSAIYKQTISNIVSAKAAFVIDLGDIFMIDKLDDKSETNIRNRYLLMKNYYDLLGSIPLYFAMGNHDGETGWDQLYTKKYRLEYFPKINLEKNYYSFEKNNALFIILDPYTYTTKKPNEDGWQWTLGETQYNWLEATLEKSKAKYKFVFIHQLVGGDNQGRGGIEYARLYEWGGYNADGSYGFDSKRPNWGKPIHQLLTDHKVNIVFKGHDHFYAKQELDSIIYQTVPQPSHAGNKIDTAGEYGYQAGTIIGGSGFIKVSIGSQSAKIEFIAADDKASVIDQYDLQ